MSDLLERGPEQPFFDHERDPEIVGFEAYRELCDTGDFRKVGVQDEASYEAVLHDQRTVFTEYMGLKIPLLAPLQYEKMYNEERCRTISGKKKAMLLAIPFSHLKQMELQDTYTIDEDTIVVVEEFVSTDDSIRLDQHDTSELPFANVEPFDFKSPALSANPRNETAWMAAYGFHMQPKEGPARIYEGDILGNDIIQKWHEHCVEEGQPEFPEERSTGTFLLSAEQLAMRPDIIEQLWEISQIGFGKILGADHPVSMEFNKQFFDKQISTSNALTAVHCVDGEIVCFSFVGFDMKNDEWLNEESDVIKDMITEAETSGSALAHVHELIGRGRMGMGHATKILDTFFEAVAKTGYSCSVFFESTNLSSMYIPPLITRNLDRSEIMTMTSDIEILGKLSYWGLVAQQSSEGSVDGRSET